MRVFNKQCGLNVQVVLPVQVKHVTAVLQDDVQGIGGLLLVGVRDHTERQPGGWWYEYPYLFDIYTHERFSALQMTQARGFKGILGP